MDRRWIIATAAVVSLAAGYGAYRLTRSAPEPSFETAAVTRGKLVARVTASGTLSALVTVQVGSQVSGRIGAINVDFNSPVKKGQVLAKLDSALFDAAVEQARANLVAAEGSLEKSRAQLVDAERIRERTKSLAEKNLVATADFDTADTNALSAKASVKGSEGSVAQARAALHQAETNLSYATITSPIDGVVISRNVDVGQTVAATLSAPTLFTLAEDLRKMQVDTSVAEADVGKLEKAMTASFFVDAYPSRRFDGAVRQIRNAAQTVQNVVTYDAVLDVANSDLALKPGMTATVTFVYAERADALLVPNGALRFHPPAAMAAKWEKKDAKKVKPDAGAPSAEGEETPKHKKKKALAEKDPEAGAPRSDAAVQPSTAAAPDAADMREIWVAGAKHPHRVMIHIGVSDGSNTEVLDGELAEGDSVVTGIAEGPSGGAKKPSGGMKRMF